MDLDGIRERLAQASTLLPSGRVESVVGLALRLSLPSARVGDLVHIHRRGGRLPAQIVGVAGSEAVAMPLGELTGVGAGDRVESSGAPLQVCVSNSLLGRVLDGLGEPVDGLGPIEAGAMRPVEGSPPSALSRRAVERVLPTGVRVIDGLMTLGEGQRVGLFAGSGVGKSTLLGAIARGTAADVVVVALVGERGREVSEFLAKSLGGEALRRSVVVVATSDAPALQRLAAANTSTAIAEHFRDQGARVMLLVDSVTRFARAQREVGLAAGEPPARRGYPPSVFAALPRLLERSGQSSQGSITAIYTVLVEGGDMDEPVADEVRGILDGHIVLDRAVASRGRYPAVDVLNSLSRVMDGIVEEEHRKAAVRVRKLVGTYEARRDLIAIGAYARGSDRELDAAIERMPKIEALLGQGPTERTEFGRTVEMLQAIR